MRESGLDVLFAVITLAAAASACAQPGRPGGDYRPVYGAEHFDLQAHRGGLGLVVENTLPAFDNALRLGVSTLELDIQLTEDKHAIITHDRRIASNKCRDTAPAFPGDPEFPYLGRYVKDRAGSHAGLRVADTSVQLPSRPGQRPAPGAKMPLSAEVFELVARRHADQVIFNIEPRSRPAPRTRPPHTRTSSRSRSRRSARQTYCLG